MNELRRNITYWRLGLGGDVTTQVCGGERSARRVDKIAEGTAARSRNEVGDMSAPVKGQVGRELATFRMPMSKPHVLGNPPVWLHSGTYREL